MSAPISPGDVVTFASTGRTGVVAEVQGERRAIGGGVAASVRLEGDRHFVLVTDVQGQGTTSEAEAYRLQMLDLCARGLPGTTMPR